ncbi:MAG: aromatic-ring-hydroxylating dioxygenase subunit beta [Gammaproteobacteria bacterium]|jgi:3-phenylpropionate/cinnamic acid dioxygenase small subunit|nr:aromatic-ring-hydroxylating dioxygenase subunit beta [Gammaproteobacteria bacterium]
MNDAVYQASPAEQRALEAFYFREARLLDNRQYQQWLALVEESIHYTLPARTNVQVDNRERGNEHMISVERELETAAGVGNPLRDERFVHLMLRVERAYKVNSWSENPPPRTRRIVGNIELLNKQAGELNVVSNFLLFYARPGAREFIYSGQRRDTLVSKGASFGILRREVVLDYADIDKPTLGLLF